MIAAPSAAALPIINILFNTASVLLAQTLTTLFIAFCKSLSIIWPPHYAALATRKKAHLLLFLSRLLQYYTEFSNISWELNLPTCQPPTTITYAFSILFLT